jgi:hypothetical protein
MYDELDFYLGRRLKNWAAEHPLPADGRERLLAAAAGDGEIDRRPVSDLNLLDHLLASPICLPIQREGFQAFLTQSHVWQFRLATSMHSAA